MLRSAILFLLAFLTEAHAQGLVTNHVGDAQDSGDDVVNVFFDRVRQALDHAKLDSTTVGTPSHIAVSSRTNMKLSVPPFSSLFPLPSPIAIKRMRTEAAGLEHEACGLHCLLFVLFAGFLLRPCCLLNVALFASFLMVVSACCSAWNRNEPVQKGKHGK